VYRGNSCLQWLYRTFLLLRLPSTCRYKYSCFINKSQYKKNVTFYTCVRVRVCVCTRARAHEASIPQLIWWCRYRLHSTGTRVQFPESARIFLSSIASRSAVGSTQHPIQWVLQALSLQYVAGHLSPSTAKFKNQWNYTSMPHMLFWIVWVQLYLTLYL